MPNFDDFEEIELEEDDKSSSSSVQVISPSGATVTVMNNEESVFYNQVARRYQEDNMFSNVSDLLELDRIIIMELMCHRWSTWLLEECDYDSRPVDLDGLQKNVESYSKEIRLIKKSLGIDKSTRDKEHGDSISDYIQNLRLRAKEFGYMRNEQAVKAITLWKELEGIYTLYANSTDEERTEFKAHESDLIAWIERKIPEFNEIDDKFRKTSQSYWVREL